jgi:hypothetical protein
MRRGLGLVVAVSILASSPGSAAAPRFPTGWWQSTEVDASDGQATSFELRRTRRGRYEVRHLLTWGSNCGSGDFGDEDPRIAVDRRGRFRYRIRYQSDGISAVRGRLSGWRGAGAPLRLWWDLLADFPSSCRLTYRFAMHPVDRVPVREGRWTGTDASGRPVEFFVRDQGRYVYSLRAPGPYPVRCSDGSVNSAPVGILAAWIDVDGTVRLPWFSGDPPAEGVTLDAKLSGTSATGSFRLVLPPGDSPFRHASSCDSDPIAFQAAWVAPR